MTRSSTETRQAKMIAALLDPAHRSQESACAAVGVPRRTLQTWLLDADFQARLRQAEAQAIGDATRRLISVSTAAGATMVQVMADRANPPSVRLRAAGMVLDSLVRLRQLIDLADLEQRIEALERET